MKTISPTEHIPSPAPDLRQHHLRHVAVVRCNGQRICGDLAEHVSQLLGVPQREITVEPKLYEDRSGFDDWRSRIVLPGDVELPLGHDLVLASLTAGFSYFASTHDVCEWALAPEGNELPETSFANLPFVVVFLCRLPIPLSGAELPTVAKAIADVTELYHLEDTWTHPWSLWRRLIRHTLSCDSPAVLLDLLQGSLLTGEPRSDLCYALAKELESLSGDSPFLGSCRELVSFLLNESPLSKYWKQSLTAWTQQHQMVLGNRAVN